MTTAKSPTKITFPGREPQHGSFGRHMKAVFNFLLLFINTDIKSMAWRCNSKGQTYDRMVVSLVPQIRPLADIVHFKYSHTYLLTYLLKTLTSAGRWMYDQKIMSLTCGRIAIKWLLLGWVTVCGQVNYLGI